MNIEEYLTLYHKHTDRTPEETKALIEYNKALVEKYPFLLPHNRWSGKPITTTDKGYWPGDPDQLPDYDWTYTEMDSMPEGWRLSFGDQMLEELREELIKFNFLEEYMITEIKEKYGTLRWYDNGTPIGKLSDGPVETVFREEWGYGWSHDNPNYEKKHIVYIGKTDKGHQFDVYDILNECKVPEIISKYEKMSANYCIHCGKPTSWESKGWISFVCNKCALRELEDVNKQALDSHERLNSDKPFEAYTIEDLFYKYE